MADKNKELKEKIIHLVREAVQSDQALRQELQIGEKFRFIRDRLNTLATHVEESLHDVEAETQQVAETVTADEIEVYVYLFNAHGLTMQTWNKMISPRVFYEYSVNRPIYTEKSHIEAFIRSRSNKYQHGYLTVAIKKDQVLKSAEPLQDSIGGPVVKIKEGSLRIDRLINFTHVEKHYRLDSDGGLVLKD